MGFGDRAPNASDSLGDSVLHESFNDAGAATLMIESIVLPQRIFWLVVPIESIRTRVLP